MLMLKRKCPACAEKIERKFNFCPYCGASFKRIEDEGEFGMLGRLDGGGRVEEEVKLPFGLDKIMGSLIKQLEKQMNEGNSNNVKMPRGFQIRLSPGSGQMKQIQKRPEVGPVISREENERRASLPRVEVEAKVRRLGDSIIYEIEAPGVSKKEDVVLTGLETGLEIKAYSKDKCYVKIIPLKVEVLRYEVQKEKVFVEIKG
jgi:HSP20 family molecular chaperone IbpA